MRRADTITSGVIFALGLVIIFVLIPYQIPGHEGEGYALQAADFPRVVAIAMTILSGVLLLSRLAGKGVDASQASPIGTVELRFLAMSTAILVAIFLLMKFAGFLVGAAFAITCFMYVMGVRSVLPIVLMAVVAPAAIWLFFWKLLGFPLP